MHGTSRQDDALTGNRKDSYCRSPPRLRKLGDRGGLSFVLYQFVRMSICAFLIRVDFSHDDEGVDAVPSSHSEIDPTERMRLHLFLHCLAGKLANLWLPVDRDWEAYQCFA